MADPRPRRSAPASARPASTSTASRRASRTRRARGSNDCARGWRRPPKRSLWRPRGRGRRRRRSRGRPSPATRSPARPARRRRRWPPIEPGDRLVVFVGKLIASKGVELLLAAWPLVLAREPRARLLVVGFGAFRAGLEGLARDLERGDLEAARALRSEHGDELPHLASFLDGLEDPDGLPRRRARHDRADRVGGTARPRRADRRAARCRGDGRPQHVPGGVRHGRRRGRGLRRAARGGRAFRAGRGRPHARRRGPGGGARTG